AGALRHRSVTPLMARNSNPISTITKRRIRRVITTSVSATLVMSQIAEIEAYCSMQPLSLSADKKFPVCSEYDRQNQFCKEQQKSSQALILSSHRLSPLPLALVRLSCFSPEDTSTTVRTGRAAGAMRGAFRLLLSRLRRKE